MQISNSRRGAACAISVAAVALALSACSENAPTASAPATGSQEAATAPAASLPPAPAVAAPAGGDAVYRGAAIARQVCAQCHDIGDGSKPAVYSQAPTFKAVVEKPETTADGLARWLQSSHPSMPHYMFPDAEVADIVAYMMSLRPASPS